MRSARIREAARLAGIPVERRVFLAFALSGAIAGVAGAFWLSRHRSVDAIAGQGYEFQAIAAVVVGGVAPFGGSGTVLGAALGALLLNTIDSALVALETGAPRSPARCSSPQSLSTGRCRSASPRP